MADSAVAVTAGTGTNIDTRTEGTNGNHRQVIVIGDPATNTGIAPVDATYGLSVDVTRSALPSGASTSAKQDTIISHIDNVEGLLTTIDADTGNISTKIDTIAAAVSGTEMQVDVVSSALPTGASTLAEQQTQTTHLATIAGDTTNIETSVQLIDDTVATLGTTTYTEAATKGLIIGAVRRDADTTLVDTTNEVGPVQMNAAGQLKVEVFSGETLPVSLTSTTVTGTVAVTQSGTWDEVGINDSGNSITVDNGGTFAVQVDGSALTSLQLIDDVVYTDDTSTHSTGTSKGVGMMAAAVPTDTSISANDIGMVGMSTDRRLYGDVTLQVADTDVSTTNPVPTKGVPSDIDINGSNANHAQKYYTSAGAVTDGIIWSPAAGKRWHVLTLYINVSAACTVTLEDDLAGGDSAVWKGELAANSGVVLTYDKEHPFSSTEDAADLIITTTAGNVYVQAVGYEV